MRKIVKVGLVQMRCRPSPEDNLTQAVIRIGGLAKRGAQIVALPELFLMPYFCQTKDKKFFELAEPVPGPATRALQAIAKKNRVVLTTSVYERAGGTPAPILPASNGGALRLQRGGPIRPARSATDAGVWGKIRQVPRGTAKLARGTFRAPPSSIPLASERVFWMSESKFYNTAVVIDADGKYLGKYRKMHIPDDPKFYYGEAYYFSPGDLGVPVFKTRYGKIATLICWDQWFPEGARMAAVKGAEIIFYPTAIGYQLKARPGVNEAEHDAWQVIQRAHAIANTVYVAAVNRVGLEHKLRFWGTSFVADPYGRVLARASTTREEDMLVSCDLNVIAQMRKEWPFLAARRIKMELSK